MTFFFLSLLLIISDQVVKYLVRVSIPIGEVVPFIPAVLGLTHAQNTGAAFSLFAGHTWVLTLISAVMTGLLTLALAKRWLVRHGAARVCLAMVLAGSAGNLIDRALFGSVTDMFVPLFMDFAVFNIADACLVVGGIGLCLYLLFFYDRLEGQE